MQMTEYRSTKLGRLALLDPRTPALLCILANLVQRFALQKAVISPEKKRPRAPPQPRF